jgi:hypothetical protein
MYSLSSLMSLLDGEFDVLGEDKLVMLTRRFERLHESWVNTRRTTQLLVRQARTLHCHLSVEDGEQGQLQVLIDNREQAPIEVLSQE